MRTIQELMHVEKLKKKTRMELQAANITDTSTTNASTWQMTTYADEVIKFGEDFRYLQNICDHNTQLVGSRDNAVRLFTTTSHRDITTTHTEGAERTYTEMTNLSYVDATPTWYFGAIAISKEIVTTSRVDLIALAKYMLVQDAEQDIEATINTEILTATTNIKYGGDATGTSTLATGDIITTDLFADAFQALRAQNFKPKFFAAGTAQEQAFLKDSQFVNAAEYGGREVLMNGEIGKYLGVKIIITTNITTSTTWGSGGATSGNNCYMLGTNNQGQSPCTIAWKQKPTYSYEYLPRYCNHYLYSDACYDVELTQEKGVCLIRVTNA